MHAFQCHQQIIDILLGLGCSAMVLVDEQGGRGGGGGGSQYETIAHFP